MSNGKILRPTLRERHRYLAFHLIAESKIEFPDILNAITHAFLNFLGEQGLAKAGAQLVRDSYNPEKNMGLIRCRHTAVEDVRVALGLVQRIGDVPVIFHVIGASGTIKCARKKFFGEIDLKSFT